MIFLQDHDPRSAFRPFFRVIKSSFLVASFNPFAIFLVSFCSARTVSLPEFQLCFCDCTAHHGATLCEANTAWTGALCSGDLGDLKAERAGNFMVSEVSVINIVSVGSSLHNTRYGSKFVSEFGDLRINWVVHSNLHPESTTIWWNKILILLAALFWTMERQLTFWIKMHNRREPWCKGLVVAPQEVLHVLLHLDAEHEVGSPPARWSSTGFLEKGAL